MSDDPSFPKEYQKLETRQALAGEKIDVSGSVVLIAAVVVKVDMKSF